MTTENENDNPTGAAAGEHGDLSAPAASGALQDGKSLLKRAQERRDGREDVLPLDIPSWDGELRAKYKVLPRAELEAMLRNIRDRERSKALAESGKKGNGFKKTSSEDATVADVNFLVSACVGVFAVDLKEESESLVASGYNHELMDALDKTEEDFKRAVDLVLYMFKGNDIALAAHAQKVSTWMKDTTAELDPQ